MPIHFYKVGGCVRDALLGLKSNDIDYSVVIDEPFPTIGEAFAHMREHLLSEGYEIFLEQEDCLTIRARLGRETSDFVLARKEIGYIEGTRKPIVVQGTLEDDLSRRDFTINALAEDSEGKIIDLFGGLKDLDRGILRTPLDPMVTLTDDPLRALRAIRFRIRFDFMFDDGLWLALHNRHLPALMHVVSLERIREELHKAFKINTLATLDLLHSLPRALVETWIRDGLWLMPTTKE